MKTSAPENPMQNLTLHGKTYRLSIRRDGRLERINLQTADPAVAIQRKRELLSGPMRDTPKGSLLDDARRYIVWKVSKGLFSRASARVCGAALEEFAEATRGTTQDVRVRHLEEHYARLQARVSEASAQIHMRSIAAFFTWCVECVPPLCVKHPGKIVADGVVRPAFAFKKIANKARQRYCTREERDQLIDGAPTDDLKFIFFCGFHAGMRKNEIIEARVSWFRLDGEVGVVHIENTPSFRIKGDAKPRFVPLSEKFRTFLRGYLAGKPADGWALRPEVQHGRGIYRYDFHAPYNYYLCEQRLRWVTAHVMRHTFASLLAQKGVSIYKVANWLGDGVQTTVDHYAHLAPQDRELEAAM